MSDLLACLDAFFVQEGNTPTFWLAFSGGLDSHVLLHLCVTLRKKHALKLRVIHINHQLQTQAAQWAVWAEQKAREYGLPFESATLQLQSQTNIEAHARAARYALFAERLQAHDLLLTAHHAEDQAETVLLQLLRGSGLPGLSAMPIKTVFAKGFHARPLLHVQQERLKAYALAEKLEWIEDPSNRDPQFSRNYLRHQILPLLKARWPSFATTFSRSASLCQEGQDLLSDMAEELISEIAGSLPNTLSLSAWQRLSAAKQRLVLRHWLQKQGVDVPEQAKLLTLQQQLHSAAVDRQPKVEWGGVCVRRYRDNIFLGREKRSPLPLVEEGLDVGAIWDLSQPLTLGSGTLTATAVQGKGLKVGNVVVKMRAPGQCVKLLKRGTRELKKLFQALGVPPWQRATLPLIFHEDKLICIPGYFMETQLIAEKNEDGFEFSWNCL